VTFSPSHWHVGAGYPAAVIWTRTRTSPAHGVKAGACLCPWSRCWGVSVSLDSEPHGVSESVSPGRSRCWSVSVSRRSEGWSGVRVSVPDQGAEACPCPRSGSRSPGRREGAKFAPARPTRSGEHCQWDSESESPRGCRGTVTLRRAEEAPKHSTWIRRVALSAARSRPRHGPARPVPSLPFPARPFPSRSVPSRPGTARLARQPRPSEGGRYGLHNHPANGTSIKTAFYGTLIGIKVRGVKR
jgi:hypothetical protein